jgi:hypothetical protein
LRRATSDVTAQGQRAELESTPDLAAVVAAWPTLPEPIRAGIMAMVKGASVLPQRRVPDKTDETPEGGGGGP